MRLKTVFVFSLLVLFLFALMVCGTKEEMEAEEEAPVVEAPKEKVIEMTKEEKMMDKMFFSEEAEIYIEEVKEEKWMGKHPKMKLADRLIELKTQFEGNIMDAAGGLERLDAQIMIDEKKIENIKEFIEKNYSDRNFVFEIQKVSVEKVPDEETRYLGEETEENRVDLMAHVEFTFSLVQTPGSKNQSGTGTFGCLHRNDCHWGCEF
ncbi:MAG: hypothetical protein ACQERH_11640 [Acidobacteriota bacterium]